MAYLFSARDWAFREKANFDEDISHWDVSKVTDMEATFKDATSFNGNLSRWNVSNVTCMDDMFEGATSFDQQLGGAWARSTASKDGMLRDCPGSVVGMTTDIHGTPA